MLHKETSFSFAASSSVLETRGIRKAFPGVRVLENVSLSVLPGQVLALMGENGAGKSTLMKILAGALKADECAGRRR